MKKPSSLENSESQPPMEVEIKLLILRLPLIPVPLILMSFILTEKITPSTTS
jgi:hypothetical protein